MRTVTITLQFTMTADASESRIKEAFLRKLTSDGYRHNGLGLTTTEDMKTVRVIGVEEVESDPFDVGVAEVAASVVQCHSASCRGECGTHSDPYMGAGKGCTCGEAYGKRIADVTSPLPLCAYCRDGSNP